MQVLIDQDNNILQENRMVAEPGRLASRPDSLQCFDKSP